MGKRSFAARLQQLFSAHDMTLGAPWKRILEFAIPMLIGNLAQQLYNTADSIIVGRYVGDNALAAVGSASPILNLLLALFVGVATGVGILVAQRYGAKDREQLSPCWSPGRWAHCSRLSPIASAPGVSVWLPQNLPRSFERHTVIRQKSTCGHIVRRCFCLSIFLYSSGCSSSSVPSA